MLANMILKLTFVQVLEIVDFGNSSVCARKYEHVIKDFVRLSGDFVLIEGA